MKIILGLICTVMILGLASCNNSIGGQPFSTTSPVAIITPRPTPTSASVNSNKQKVLIYLKDKGYNIVGDYGEEGKNYVVTKDFLLYTGESTWSVQTIKWHSNSFFFICLMIR